MMRSTTGRRGVIAGALLASVALALPVSSPATPKLKPPHASTGSAQHVSESGVALNATVNPHGQETTCYFQYGTTTAYGAQTPTAAVGSGVAGVKVSQPISGLQPATTYHFRIVATNGTGTSDGQDHTFTTKQVPLKFVIVKTSRVSAFGGGFSLSGTLTGNGGAGHQVILQASPFPYLNGFADVGAAVSTNAEGGFSLSIPSLTQSTQLRVRTLDTVPTYSQVVTIHVAALVTLHSQKTSRGLVRLSGVVTPAEAGAPVLFQWMRSGHPPVTVGSAVVGRAATASSSRFSATVRIRHAGYYRALVKVSNGRLVSGSSRSVLLRATPVAPKTHRRRR